MSLAPLLAEIRACTHCAAHLPLGPRPVVRAAASARLMIIGQAPGTRVHETGIPWHDRSGERLRDWLQVEPETFYDETRVAIMPMGFCYPGVIGDTRIPSLRAAPGNTPHPHMDTSPGGDAGEASAGRDGGKRESGDARKTHKPHMDTSRGGGAGEATSGSDGGKKERGDAGKTRKPHMDTSHGGGAGEATNGSDGGKKESNKEPTKKPKKSSPGDAPPRPECAPLWHARLLAELPNIELTLLVGQYAQAHYLGKARSKTLTETVSRYAEFLPQGFLPLPHPSWRTTGWQRKQPWFDEELLPVLQARVAGLMG